MSNEVKFSVTGHIATITLNRPEKLNAMTQEMTSLLKKHIATCNENDEIRVVLLTAEGDRAFCADLTLWIWIAMQHLGNGALTMDIAKRCVPLRSHQSLP